jgi:hypothetical protein
MKKSYKFKGEVWRYPAMHGAWHFVSLPKKNSVEIKKTFGTKSRGWGSLPVKVSLGKCDWRTSIFPDKKSETYLLPIKSQVLKKERLENGDMAKVSIKIIV